MTKQEKILAITSIAKDIADEAVYAARYNRKTLRIIRKKPFNKRKGQLMKVEFMFKMAMSSIQVATVLSQPVPKYPRSGVAKIGGEDGKEECIRQISKPVYIPFRHSFK